MLPVIACTMMKIIWTIGLLIFVTTMHAQTNGRELNKVWELDSVEDLSGMGGLGDEMKRLDMRSETQLTFGDGGRSETVLYKVIGQEIKLFTKDGNHVGQDIIWKIETLTADEFGLLLIAREDNEKLARLKYRVKG